MATAGTSHLPVRDGEILSITKYSSRHAAGMEIAPEAITTGAFRRRVTTRPDGGEAGVIG